MVDLVKIRKKAKSREPAAAAPEPGVSPAQGPAPAPVPASAQPSAVAAEPAATPVPESAHAPIPESSPKLEKFKQTAGKSRANFIAEAAESVSGEQIELLTFLIAGEQYAVSIDHLVEIITPRDATPVPNSGPTIVGILSLRGTIVTVIDVRRILGHPPAARGIDGRIIVAERGGETLGFEVDRVLRVLKVDSSAIEPHPVVHSSELSEAVRGVFRHADALTILLDLDKLLA